MAQKSWPSGAPARAAAACMAEMPGATTISMRALRSRPGEGPPASQAFEDQRRHRVDAGIAGGDERDGAALRRERQRLPHARLLRAERGIEALGVRDERRDEIEIERVADGGVACLRAAGAPPASASPARPGPMPTIASRPRARPTAVGVDDVRRFGDGAGDARALRLGDDERAVRAGGGERRAFGDAVAADLAEHRLRRILQPRRLRLERRGGEEARRHAELLRAASSTAGSSAFRSIEATSATDAAREPGLVERAPDKVDRLGRIGVALAADPDRERRG